MESVNIALKIMEEVAQSPHACKATPKFSMADVYGEDFHTMPTTQTKISSATINRGSSPREGEIKSPNN